MCMNLVPHESRVTALGCASVRLKGWGSASFLAPYWRFYWNRNRGAQVMFEGRVTRLAPGRYLIIPPNTDFKAELHSPVTHFFAHFEAAAPYDRIRPGVYEGRVNAHIRSLITLVHSLADDGSESALHRASMSLHALLNTALANLPESLLSFRKSDYRIDRVLQLLAERLDRLCPNEELAEIAGMNVNAFIRRFGEIVGDSPQHYHLRQRIEKACMMLHFGTASIDQISERVGFCDRYHFSHVFKRICGVGPAAFRRARPTRVTGSPSAG